MIAAQTFPTLPPASRIASRLYQGDRRCLSRRFLRDFSVLVLCAEELQPTELPPHLKVMRCPLVDEDRPLSDREMNLIVHTARRAARTVLRDQRTLITCNAGLNRSGLVTATTLHFLTARPGFECVRTIQKRRPGALFNRAFVQTLYGLH